MGSNPIAGYQKEELNVKTVGIDLSKLTTEQRKFVTFVISKAEREEIEVILSPDPYVSLSGTNVSGYFDEDTFAVGCGRPVEQWFEVFVHESCHMDQFLEDDPVWTAIKITPDVDVYEVIDLWTDHHIELSDEQRMKYLEACFAIERNCEERVLKAVDQWQLPIDKREYAQKSNAYIWFYYIIGLIRKWYPYGKEPYHLKELWSMMPSTTAISFKPPQDIVDLFLFAYQ